MEATNQTETFEEALERFRVAAEACIADYFKTNFPTLQPDKLVVDPNGQRYIRVVKVSQPEASSKSVYCFVERATGNVLKADGWKRPAKGVRGTIYTHTFNEYGVTKYGANYNK